MNSSKLLFASIILLIALGCKKDDPNKIPVANAGSSTTITLPTDSLTVTGTGIDPDGKIIAYLWSEVSGPASTTIVNPGSPSTKIKGFVHGNYVFQLMVTDNEGASGVDTVSVTVNPDPNPTTIKKVPTADAGPSKTVNLPMDTVTLSGTGTDQDGQITAYLWSEVSGPSSATIVNPGSPSTKIKGFVQGKYVFQLMVTDNDGQTGVDTVSVTVNAPAIQTTTLQPSNNPDEKMLVSIGGSDQSFTGGNEWVIDAWTVNGQPYIGRKIFKFDLSSIPANAVIQSANLYIYSNSPPENGNLVDANFGTSNSLVLQQITSSWSPSTANWQNQPSITTANQVLIPSTTQSVLDLNIDVKAMISSMVNGSANYGFMLKLQNETAFNSRQFVSSFNAAKPGLHPKLVIVYQ
ncbi:MAG: PKD domain-containing protein [Flavisolibacter sp.]